MLLKLLVERYIADGQPVGSKSLAGPGGMDLSPATIRNVLADLERMGFLHAPHTSAGRVPTERGYRYFVDSLLTPEPLDPDQQKALCEQLLPDPDATHQAGIASSMLSQLSHLAAVVTVRAADRGRLERIEFLPLSERRVLAILVLNGGDIQNRVLTLEQDMAPAQLLEAANYLNSRFAGRELEAIRQALVREVLSTQASMNELMRRAADLAQQVMRPRGADNCLISGGANLFDFEDAFSVERLRGLFEAFDRKRDLLGLIERCLEGRGIRIFIGQESGYEVLDDCSVVTAPYTVNGQLAGVVGVIGPTRMAYQRVIPLVDMTARVLGAALNSET